MTEAVVDLLSCRDARNGFNAFHFDDRERP